MYAVRRNATRYICKAKIVKVEKKSNQHYTTLLWYKETKKYYGNFYATPLIKKRK